MIKLSPFLKKFNLKIPLFPLYFIALHDIGLAKFSEKFNFSKHKIGSEIKAVTYHILEVKNKKPYHVQVLFDI